MKPGFVLGLSMALTATVAIAQDRPKPPAFFPKGDYVRSTDCKPPFTGWIAPQTHHLVVVTETTNFKDYPTANDDLLKCISGMAHVMVLGGQAHVPLEYELTDTTGRVLQSKTLDLIALFSNQ